MVRQLRKIVTLVSVLFFALFYVILFIQSSNIRQFWSYIHMTKKDELLQRTILGLKNAISYLQMDMKPFPDPEVLLMLSITQANLNATNMTKAEQKAVNDFDVLVGLVQRGLSEGFYFIEDFEPDYLKNFGDIFDPKWWSQNNWSGKSLPSSLTRTSDPPNVNSSYYSEKCLSELHNCNSTDVDRCWKYLSHSDHNMTAYKVMTVQKRCHSENKSFLLLLEKMCADFYEQSQNLQKSEIPVNLREQYCEQIFACANMGYYQLLTKENLELILFWQETNGCYATPFDAGTDFCFLRYTAMCGGALSQFARFLAKDEQPPTFLKS